MSTGVHVCPLSDVAKPYKVELKFPWKKANVLLLFFSISENNGWYDTQGYCHTPYQPLFSLRLKNNFVYKFSMVKN